MNKKFVFIVFASIIILLIFYKIISYFNLNITISKLKEYKLKKNEKIHTKFKYNNYNYAITSYSSNVSVHDNNHILLNHKNKYYLLESIDKCDMNSYIDDNSLYVHCIGYEGNIKKYIINKSSIKSSNIKLDYSDTPNISQLHIVIDNIDNKYIYLSSGVKIDDSIKEGNKVKCSLNSRKCKYY